MRDYLHILGVPGNAGGEAIRDACRRLTRRYHPDIGGDCAVTGHAGGEPRAARAARAARVGMSGGAPDWPLDEIAIDFPSVAPIVDRMRAAFFAERAPVWSAHIELTRREARDGAEVPIDVPQAETCAACGGRGEIWADGCVPCGGAGTRPGAHRVRLLLPPGVAHGARLFYQLRLPAGAPAMLAVSVGVDRPRA